MTDPNPWTYQFSFLTDLRQAHVVCQNCGEIIPPYVAHQCQPRLELRSEITTLAKIAQDLDEINEKLDAMIQMMPLRAKKH